MVHDVRELNRGAVLTELLSSRPASRKHIAAASGVSAATVTRVVDELISDGILAEGDDIVVERRGRRARSVDLVADRALVLGVDLGASNTRFLLTDLLAGPLLASEQPTPADLDPSGLARWLVDKLRSSAGASWSAVGYVSLGLPGAVNHSEHTVSNAPNLAQVEDAAFLNTFRDALGVPIQVDNDANFALLGEQRFGAARLSPTAAMLTLGEGLGTAIAIDGRILRGRHGLVGEFGQLPAGPLGSRLEHMVTGPGILRRAAEANVSIESPAELFAEDAIAPIRALRSQFDQALLIVLTAIVVSCEPATIVLGGGISKSLGTSLEQYEEALEHTIRYAPRLVPAGLSDFSGAVGAVVASLHAAYLDIGVQRDALSKLPASQTLNLKEILADSSIAEP